MRTIPKHRWSEDHTRLPMFFGRLVASHDVCYLEHGHGMMQDCSGIPGGFQLSQFKKVLEELGSGRHAVTAVRHELQERLGATVDETLFGKALGMLEKKGWVHIRSDQTVELTD